MKQVQGIIAVLLLMIMAACAQLAPAESFDQKLAYGYGAVTAARKTAENGLKSNLIKVDDAKQVQDLADQARALLDSARQVRTTDLSTATAKLALATTVLTQLQTYLTARGLN